MKLIFLLLLVIAPLILCSTNYLVLGDLPKYGSKSFYPSVEGETCCYCIKLSDFTKGSGLYFKITLTSGNFLESNMHIGGSNEKINKGNTMNLLTQIPNEYYSSKLNALYFYIAEPGNFNDLYVASPALDKYDYQSEIIITNTKGPTYFVLGDLSKYGSQEFNTINKGKYAAYGIRTDYFPNDKYVYFRTTINYGSFAYEYMYYGGSDIKLSDDTEITLFDSVSYYSYRSNAEYYFVVPKTVYKYLYVAPPPPYGNAYQVSYTIKVENIFGVTYTMLGELPKYGEKSFSPYYKGIYCAYYIRTKNFTKDSNLYFNISTYPEDFQYSKMYYIGSNTEYRDNSELTFFSEPTYVLSSNNTFIVPKTSYNYLYFAPSTSNYYTSQTKITVSNLYRPYKIKYNVLGELNKYSNETFEPSREGIYNTYYIKIDDLPNNSILKFKVELDYGTFEHEYMFYGYYNKALNNESTITLPSNAYHDSSGIYKISTASFKYLYFAPPPVYSYESRSSITIYNTDITKSDSGSGSSSSNKVAVGVGVGVACFVVIVVIVVIAVVKGKNRGIDSTYIDTRTEPIHLTGSKY